MTGDLSAGFTDPVTDAQSSFRALLDAMSRPGQIHCVNAAQGPSPLANATGAAILTLVDHETPLWLDPAAKSAERWITFHTGAPIVGVPDTACFALALSMPDLANFALGSDESPESSATIILQVQSLSHGERFTLTGPGLREPATLTVDGLPPGFASIWAANHGLFPRGIDLILCAGDQVAALPRSVTVKEA
jgi:alpha-D-ribose 1-methylphosphonate 5-triphosphate synthase subunit PhnH